MNRPTPDPSQEGSRLPSASSLFPSSEGLGVGSWSQCMRKSESRLSINHGNIEHRTSNSQHPMMTPNSMHWMFDVGCWTLDVFQRLGASKRELFRRILTPLLPRREREQHTAATVGASRCTRRIAASRPKYPV